MLAAAPGLAEGEGLGRRLAARIERGQLAGLVQVIRFGHGADQPPVADLMAPAPPGSAYLESVSAELKALDDDLARWEKTLFDGLIR